MSRATVLEAVLLDAPDSAVEPNVSLDEFFPPRFMQAHTDLRTFEEFRTRHPSAFDDRSDLESIPKDRLDRYVARVTSFDSWREMRNRAAEREVREHLLI